MKLLYISVHQVLEYDELRMFLDSGHDVFALGAYFDAPPTGNFRPPLHLGPGWRVLKAQFAALGGRYAEDPAACVIPPEFVELFDACIVMHEAGFFQHHWPALSRIPVIWRTIGVDIFDADPAMMPYRDAGCRVVRYSPMEATVPGHVGTDATIRFPKKIADFRPWSGDDPVILKFYTNFRQRLPVEHQFVERLAAGRRFILGGAGNEGCAGAIGMVGYERQLELLSSSRVYFYGAGLPAPYTLNFMEAWLAGIPVVALQPELIFGRNASRFTEIARLIAHGRDGFVVGTVKEAGEICDRLLRDHDLARRIGRNGARKAAALFDDRAIARQWNAVFHRIAPHKMPSPASMFGKWLKGLAP